MQLDLGSEYNPVRYYIGGALILASNGITFGKPLLLSDRDSYSNRLLPIEIETLSALGN